MMGCPDPVPEQLIARALRCPSHTVAYAVSQQLGALCPDRALLEGEAHSFQLEAFIAAGLCTARPKPSVHCQIVTEWDRPNQGLLRFAENAWYEVSWQSHMLDVLLVSWWTAKGRTRRFWILAHTAEMAEWFYRTVCEWGAEVRGEILVFEGGEWRKSGELFQSIQDASFDNLILRGSLKRQIQDDLSQFFASQELYEEYHIPWKRGILFIGPPGNGKTHAVKAVINSLRRPCLYVRSFRSETVPDEANIRAVFGWARQRAPCLLVLEDLDSLVTSQNRSYFLNELDGFAANAGIVTLATTNHPALLDPAILHRPSRFDRKYPFDLPGPAERAAYLRLWNDTFQEALRLSEPEIMRMVELIDGFSFAYIKELVLSSMTRWISWPEPDGMGYIMAAQAAALREQMSTHSEMETETPATRPASSRTPLSGGGRRSQMKIRRLT